MIGLYFLFGYLIFICIYLWLPFILILTRVKIITLINQNASGVYNVGSPESHTLYDLAKQTKEDVSSSDKILNENMPTDTSMSTVKFHEFICNIKS